MAQIKLTTIGDSWTSTELNYTFVHPAVDVILYDTLNSPNGLYEVQEFTPEVLNELNAAIVSGDISLKDAANNPIAAGQVIQAYNNSVPAPVQSVNSKVGTVVIGKVDVGLGNVDNTSDTDKPVSTATQSALDAKADLVGGKVPAGQLPSFVDDVEEYANLAAFPGTGEAGKMYIALDTNKIYRWATTVYVEISENLDATEVKTLYESNTNTNAYTDAEKTIVGNTSGINTGDQTITLTGDVTGSGTGSFAATIANDAVSNSKLANMAANTVKVNDTASTADPKDLAMPASTFLARLATGNIVAATVAQVKTLIGNFTAALAGLVPASGGGTTNFLRADGTWAAPPTSVTPFEASATSTITTTSGSYTVASGMTLTPGAGDYIAYFSSSVENNSDNETTFVAIYVDGVIQAHTERRFKSEASIPNTPVPIATQCQVISLGAGQAIEARWKRSDGTSKMYQRTLTLIKIG